MIFIGRIKRGTNRGRTIQISIHSFLNTFPRYVWNQQLVDVILKHTAKSKGNLEDCACHQPKLFRIEVALLPAQDRIPRHDPAIRSDGGHEINTPEAEAASTTDKIEQEDEESSTEISGVATSNDHIASVKISALC